MIEQLMNSLNQLTDTARYGAYAILLVTALILFSLILMPFMYLYNRLTDKNQSNVLAQKDYVIGELTERISGDSFGEVREIGSGDASSVYPARFYREEDRQKQQGLPVGTKVLIIDFDQAGVALIVKATNY